MKYAIVNIAEGTDAGLFWNNKQGWGGKEFAEIFTEGEMKDCFLPVDGIWCIFDAPESYLMDEHFAMTEKDGLWLKHTEENWHHAYIPLQGNLWLEISIRPVNYPGLLVNCINISDELLKQHIRKEFDNGLWVAMNDCDRLGLEVGDMIDEA